METLELTKEEFEQLQSLKDKEEVLAFFSEKGLGLTDDDLDSVSGGSELRRKESGAYDFIILKGEEVQQKQGFHILADHDTVADSETRRMIQPQVIRIGDHPIQIAIRKK